MQRVLLVGATGRLGSQLTPRLLEAGYSVRIMSRRPAPTDRDPRIEWVQAQLVENQGMAPAFSNIDVVINLATNAGNAQVDIDGMAHVLEHASRVNVSHVLFPSIVGIDQIDFGYYRNKLTAERMVIESGLPYTILRATQFHSFIDFVLEGIASSPVLPAPVGWHFQSINAAEVAEQLVKAVRQGAQGRMPDIGGPELLSARSMIDAWLAIQNKLRLVIPLPVPGGLSAGFRSGLHTVPPNRTGRLMWHDFLTRKYGGDEQPRAVPAKESV